MMDFFKGQVTAKDWLIVGTIAAVLIAMCVVFYFFVHSDSVKKLSAVQDEDKLVQQDLTRAKQIKATIEDTRTEMAKITELVSEFEKRLPKEREIPMLIERFGELAEKVGLNVSLTQLPELKDATKGTNPFKVTAKGDFHRIVSFINLLERFERYVKITDLKFGEEVNGELDASFTLSTFRFIE